MENIVKIKSLFTYKPGCVQEATVEVLVTEGIGIHLVGLSDVACKEVLLRVVVAIQSLGYRIPGKKIVINILPSRKFGKITSLDLAVAIGILLATGQVKCTLNYNEFIFYGMLGLDGTLHSPSENHQGLAVAKKTETSTNKLFAPNEVAFKVMLYDNMVRVFAFSSLSEVIKALTGDTAHLELFLPCYSPKYQEFIEAIDSTEYGFLSKIPGL